MIEYGEPQYEEIISYNELSDIIEQQHLEEPTPEEKLYIFKQILDHQGPLKPTDPNYKGSSWNVRIEWEDGSITFEPLDMVAKDDPYGCAKYAKEHDLLDTTGWKRFKRLARRVKKMNRMVKQAALASKRTGPLYMFGVCVAKTEQEAHELDAIYLAKNVEPRWRKAEEHEIDALNEYSSFKDNGRNPPPKGYKGILCLCCYA